MTRLSNEHSVKVDVSEMFVYVREGAVTHEQISRPISTRVYLGKCVLIKMEDITRVLGKYLLKDNQSSDVAARADSHRRR